jgi:hypothetical protein
VGARGRAEAEVLGGDADERGDDPSESDVGDLVERAVLGAAEGRGTLPLVGGEDLGLAGRVGDRVVGHREQVDADLAR